MNMLDVAIVGAGFGGLCAAIRLRESGVTAIQVFEASGEVGGTWRDNVYPGCACDVPSHMYSYSFAPNQQWSRPYPQQQEIQDYVVRLTEKYALRPLIRLHCVVQSLHWLEPQACWQLTVAGQPVVLARHVVLATGPLSKPLVPHLPGLEQFEGVSFHSARWRHDVDLRGKRVAVIGTGASAVQFVPEIASQVAQLYVFQRTPGWVVPRLDTPYGALKRWAYRHVPGLQRLNRWRVYWLNEMVGTGFMGLRLTQILLRGLALLHLRWQVRDAALRQALTPTFNPGCKRLLISNTWFPALQNPHVQLLTQGVARITPQGVVGADGVVRPCDVIIWGTGFKATEYITPMQVFGEPMDGHTPELGAQWAEGAAATRLGITVAGFPNLFLLNGPHTNLGHNSLIFMIECQMNYMVAALRSMRARGQSVLRLRAEVQEQDYRETQQKMQATVWASGCKSWYQNARGVIETQWPGYTWEYWLQTRRFRAADYR